jgi:hypothetical protein
MCVDRYHRVGTHASMHVFLSMQTNDLTCILGLCKTNTAFIQGFVQGM